MLLRRVVEGRGTGKETKQTTKEEKMSPLSVSTMSDLHEDQRRTTEIQLKMEEVRTRAQLHTVVEERREVVTKTNQVAQKAAVAEDTFGQFFSGDSYIVLYTYKPKNREEYMLYFWQKPHLLLWKNHKRFDTNCIQWVEMDCDHWLGNLSSWLYLRLQSSITGHQCAEYHL